jgi:hypothetical protein
MRKKEREKGKLKLHIIIIIFSIKYTCHGGLKMKREKLQQQKIISNYYFFYFSSCFIKKHPRAGLANPRPILFSIFFSHLVINVCRNKKNHNFN